MKEIVKKIVQNDGRTIELRSGKLAKQSDGSVELRMGNSVLLATVVSSKNAKDDVDFLPLTVDYREKFAADGRFPGGFLKREARPTDHEILIMRLVDRILRPYFPSDYHAETQIMLSLLSHDKDVCPEALAGLGASAALAVSDIPFNGPISEVRVGRVNGEFIANPTNDQLAESNLDMVIGASIDSVAMVEGEMKEISEAEMIEAIKFAHEEIKVHCAIQNEFTAEVKKEIKREYSHENHDEDLADKVMEFCYDKFYQVAKKALDKHSRSEQFSAIKDEFKSTLSDEDVSSKSFMLNAYFKKAEKKAVRDMVLNDKVRLDGRATTDIRPITLAKTLVNFQKTNEMLKIVGGVMDSKVLAPEDVAKIATLPTLNEARAKIVGILQTPAQQIISILLAPGAKIANLAHAKSLKID